MLSPPGFGIGAMDSRVGFERADRHADACSGVARALQHAQAMKTASAAGRPGSRRCSSFITMCILLFAAVGATAQPGAAAPISDAPASARAAGFGLSERPDAYVVDTGAGLTFAVRRIAGRSGLQSAGGLCSLRWHGVEYQDPAKDSHVNSGFAGLYADAGPVAVEARQLDADTIRVTVRSGDLVHYYLARRGEPRIYMADRFGSEPKPGLLRFVVRVPWALLPHGPEPANLHGTDRTIEAHDVFARPDGQTRSKHYSNMRLLDWRYFGATGAHVGMWMVRDDNEGGSGGPFYRSLLDQGTVDQELTYIVNYGEGQTEPFRTGVLDAYTLVFTDGAPPGPVDTGWFAGAGLDGYVPPAARGAVAGTARGLDPAFAYTVGFASAQAQYWTGVGADGRFERSGMLPGVYRVTLYKNELAVAQGEVTVAAGRAVATGTLRADDPDAAPALWRIGRWDGSPREFLNGDKVTTMHPSDVRMANWRTAPFTVGASSAAQDFPAYQWQDVNDALHVRFVLARLPAAPPTLRIGITTAAFHGRPVPAIGGWQAAVPTASPQPTSRTLTVGTYRGNNTVYRFVIPLSALKVGSNDLTLSVASGQHGQGFLSPGVAYDAIDLIQDVPAGVAAAR
ncbi:rhamnogalacturonan lyase B N-terminal domain-containing protein [Xanthomonas sacchari]|uniref:rhamnogalacturonan lyase B N-terminal domain-containing protein n=1 Tax=Xanthomonas sacchari TaxID=56458 RepID=UPI003528725A